MAEHETLIKEFEAAGQGQVFRFWNALDPAAQGRLAAQAAEIDLDEISRLTSESSELSDGSYADLSPAPMTPRPESGGEQDRWKEARSAGEDALRAGRVAAFTVAGGQGTRLGYDGPKGRFPVTPIRKHSLFQVFAEKISAAGSRYGKPIPWLIMTSELNHSLTKEFFEENKYFGLDPDLVIFFQQGTMPAVDGEGKILLAAKDRIALSPDGHGGSLRALVRSGALDRLTELGCDTISYFQVDNPLVRPIDPEFIGFHLLAGSQFSSKALPKAYPEEKVGVFCRRADGRLCVVEYSDLPEELMQARDGEGNLQFDAGSIAIHVIDADFVRHIGTGKDASFRLPFHRANKKVPTVDEEGNQVEPTDPNGVKFEMFVFDALPFAENPVVIETTRPLDFSPVKNAEGVDSPESCEKDQMRLWASWLVAAGAPLETDASGLPTIKIDISPLWADSAEVLVEKWAALNPAPDLSTELVL